MKNKLLQDEITKRWHSECQVYKCKNKCFKVYAGIVFCRKHFKEEMIRNYGSLKNAKRIMNKSRLGENRVKN